MSEDSKEVFRNHRQAFEDRQEEIRRQRSLLLEKRRQILEEHVNRLLARNLRMEEENRQKPELEMTLDGNLVIRFNLEDTLIR